MDTLPKVGERFWYNDPRSGWEPCVLTVVETSDNPEDDNDDDTVVWCTGWIMSGETEVYNGGKAMFIDIESWRKSTSPVVPLDTVDRIDAFLTSEP